MARSTYVHDVIMLFGDSITQGGWEPDLNAFGQRLSHVYARKLDVLNRGYSGYNTEWAIPVFEQCISQNQIDSAPKIRILTIWFGANDACIPPSPQHVPLPKFISNLKHMISHIRRPNRTSETRILLISPPPVNTLDRRAELASRDPPAELDRDFEVTKRYAEAVGNVAKEEGVAFVDVWTKIWEAAGKQEIGLKGFLRDGLHLNAAGYDVMYNELVRVIATVYPDVHYDNLSFVFSPSNEIDRKDPAKSLRIQK